MQTIFLIGFMGAGKTTLGKKLANKLQVPFVDLDGHLCENLNVPDIKSLIEVQGIEFFRKAESETLKDLELKPSIVSTGGGTPCYYDNMDWMLANGKVVYLQMDEKTLFNRLKQTDLSTRPLLKDLDEEGLKKFIAEKLEERKPYYSRAPIIYEPLHQTPEELLSLLSA